MVPVVVTYASLQGRPRINARGGLSTVGDTDAAAEILESWILKKRLTPVDVGTCAVDGLRRHFYLNAALLFRP